MPETVSEAGYPDIESIYSEVTFGSFISRHNVMITTKEYASIQVVIGCAFPYPIISVFLKEIKGETIVWLSRRNASTGSGFMCNNPFDEKQSSTDIKLERMVSSIKNVIGRLHLMIEIGMQKFFVLTKTIIHFKDDITGLSPFRRVIENIMHKLSSIFRRLSFLQPSSKCVAHIPASANVSIDNITWSKRPVNDSVTLWEPSLKLLCDFTPMNDDALYYSTEWFIDDMLEINNQTVQESSKDKAVIFLTNFTARAKKIQCRVGVKREASNKACNFTLSPPIYLALKDEHYYLKDRCIQYTQAHPNDSCKMRDVFVNTTKVPENAVSDDSYGEAINKLLSDLPKRSPNFVKDSIPLCDRYIHLPWYPSTPYDIVTSPNQLLKCGTLYSVWLNEAHPDCVMETPSHAEVSFHNISWKTTGSGGDLKHDPSVNLICDFTSLANDSLYYNIDWYIDRVLVVDDQTVQHATKDQAVLTAHDFLAKGKKIGSLVHCVVGAKKAVNKIACNTISSFPFYAGVQVLTPQLSIPRKGSASLRLKLTIPYADHNLVLDGKEESPSPFYIQIAFPKNIESDCTSEGSAQQCGIEINGYSYGNRSVYETDDWKKEYAVTIYNKDTVGYDIETHLTLRLSTGAVNGVASKIFENVLLPDIPVSIYEDTSTSVWKGRRCYAHSDPHMMTFDGRFFECQPYGCVVGKTYILYRNDKYKQQVQVKHQQCLTAGCICAVAVQAGRDIFIIDRCSGTKYIDFPFCEDKELKVIKVYDRQYKIYLPTGTQVILNLWPWNISGINVDIYPTVSDVGNTDGLCGTLDGDWTNDFLNRKTNVIHAYAVYPDVFSQSWSLEANEVNDIFSSRFNNFTSLSTSVRPLCTCFKATKTARKGNTECSYKSYTECEKNSKGKEYNCALYPTGSKRRRRASQRFHAGRNGAADVHNFDGTVVHVQKRKSMPMSKDEATRICALKFEQSELYITCLLNVPNFSNFSLENCIKDLSLTGEVNLTELHLEAALSQCVYFVQLNRTLQKEQPELSYQIISLCPNNCSGHGICNEGNCTCDVGHAGSDCSFDISGPRPMIEKIEGDWFCDKAEDICDDITMMGEYFLENMGAICYMQIREIQINGVVNRKIEYEVPLQERTFYEGYCELKYQTNDTWITEFVFNISIDGNRFTDTYKVFVYQSSCQILNNENGSVYFTLQEGYCFIEGQCVTDRANKTNNICLYCDTTANKYNWSLKKACNVATSSPVTYESTIPWVTNPVDSSLQSSPNFVQQTSSQGSQTTAEGIDVLSIPTTSDNQSVITISLAVAIAVFAVVNVIITIKITMKKCQKRKNQENISEKAEQTVLNNVLEDFYQTVPNTCAATQSAPLATNYKYVDRIFSGVSDYSHIEIGNERPQSFCTNIGDRVLSPTNDFTENFYTNRTSELFCTTPNYN